VAAQKHQVNRYHQWRHGRCVVCQIPKLGTKARYLYNFWRKVNKTDTCWLWAGTIYRNGYGQFGTNGERRAHRISWALSTGKNIPHDKEIDHLCRVHSCVNPAHLEVVTHKENIGRSLKRPYCKRGHRQTLENRYTAPSTSYSRCKPCMRMPKVTT